MAAAWRKTEKRKRGSHVAHKQPHTWGGGGRKCEELRALGEVCLDSEKRLEGRKRGRVRCLGRGVQDPTKG